MTTPDSVEKVIADDRAARDLLEQHLAAYIPEDRLKPLTIKCAAVRAIAAALQSDRLAAMQGEVPSCGVLQLGIRGAAYDLPSTRRAFTYDHQPGNVDASKLGRACVVASNQSAGDSIDRGLSLLKALKAEGFGVFQADPLLTTAPAPVSAGDGFLQAVRQLAFAARTSGGTAGRDEGLCASLDKVEAMLEQATPMADSIVYWQERALNAERDLDRMCDAHNAENGPTFMGEPILATTKPQTEEGAVGDAWPVIAEMVGMFSSYGFHDMEAKVRQWADRLAAYRLALAQSGCQWSFDSYSDSWDTACGEKWQFTSDGPAENNFRFCHGCGHPVQPLPPTGGG